MALNHQSINLVCEFLREADTHVVFVGHEGEVTTRIINVTFTYL